MMGVPRGATPTITLNFTEPDLDLTQASGVYVTFTDNKSTVTKTGTDLQVDTRQINVTLTQADTLSFGVGRVQIQANWVYPSGERVASNIVPYDFSKQLLEEVIP